MFGFFAAAPDPAGMTCEAIIKGYKLNQRMAQERSGQHKNDAEKRVTELTPFYKSCQEQAAVNPVLQQGKDVQSIINQAYGDGSPGPVAMSSTFSSPGDVFNTGTVLMFAGVAALGLVVFVVMRKRGSK